MAAAVPGTPWRCPPRSERALPLPPRGSHPAVTYHRTDGTRGLPPALRIVARSRAPARTHARPLAAEPSELMRARADLAWPACTPSQRKKERKKEREKERKKEREKETCDASALAPPTPPTTWRPIWVPISSPRPTTNSVSSLSISTHFQASASSDGGRDSSSRQPGGRSGALRAPGVTAARGSATHAISLLPGRRAADRRPLAEVSAAAGRAEVSCCLGYGISWRNARF